jgi:hypothetical protein
MILMRLDFGFQCPLEICVFCDLAAWMDFLDFLAESLRFSALSSFVCSATRAPNTSTPSTSTFQCPLELCVFCDLREAKHYVEAYWGFSALSSFVCSATQNKVRRMGGVRRFQCPLELCVFCDSNQPARGSL